MTDYKEVFGHNPEPWRGPLGALRLTLTPGDPQPWVTKEDGVRHGVYDKSYIGRYGREEMIYDPRPEFDPPWTLERAREECEELVRVLNEEKIK